MQVPGKDKTEITLTNISFNDPAKRFFLPGLDPGKKKRKERRKGVSPSEIEKLILNLPICERSAIIKKLLEASLINKKKPRINKKNILIMQFVSEGYTYKQISVMTFLSPRTVENKVYKLTKEFNCKNRTHLAIKLMRAYVIK